MITSCEGYEGTFAMTMSELSGNTRVRDPPRSQRARAYHRQSEKKRNRTFVKGFSVSGKWKQGRLFFPKSFFFLETMQGI